MPMNTPLISPKHTNIYQHIKPIKKILPDSSMRAHSMEYHSQPMVKNTTTTVKEEAGVEEAVVEAEVQDKDAAKDAEADIKCSTATTTPNAFVSSAVTQDRSHMTVLNKKNSPITSSATTMVNESITEEKNNHHAYLYTTIGTTSKMTSLSTQAEKIWIGVRQCRKRSWGNNRRSPKRLPHATWFTQLFLGEEGIIQ